MKREMTVETIKQAVADGAKSVSQIAIAHGYPKPVSGGVTAKIRKLVPNVAELCMLGVPQAVEPQVELKTVEPQVDEPQAVIKVVQRKKPYGGKLYGAVYNEAVNAGKIEFRTFVKTTAEKLNLTEKQVFIAANVMRIPKHQSNGNRSKDIAAERGFMHLVPCESEG